MITPTPTNTVTPTPSFTPVVSGLPEQKIFILQRSENSIIEFTVGLPNIMNTLSPTGVTFDLSGQAVKPTGMFIDPLTGSFLFVVETTAGPNIGSIFKYILSPVWDASGIVYSGQSLFIGDNPANPFGILRASDIHFNPQGTVMFILDDSEDTVYQYDLSSPWDLTTVTYADKSLVVHRSDTKPYNPVSFTFAKGGFKMYILDRYTQTVDQFALSVSFDISTGVYEKSFRLNPNVLDVFAVEISADGTRLFVDLGTGIQSYALSTPFDIGTAITIGFSGDSTGGRTDGFNIREVLVQTPVPTVTPTNTPTATPTATVTPTVTPSPTPLPYLADWDTTSGGAAPAEDTITLPLVVGGTYNFTVDWGDSSSDIITSFGDPDKIHTYSSPGVYTVSIIGTCQGWNFDTNPTEKTKFKEVTQWGALRLLAIAANAFKDCTNLTISATDILPVSNVTNMAALFRNCTLLDVVPNMGLWDVSAVTDMNGMFLNATVFNQNIDGWNVSAVTNMRDMFLFAPVFNQDISSWVVSAVTNMNGMFQNAVAFNQDISLWDVSAVTDMNSMFQSAIAFNQDIGSWIVSAVTDMNSMFFGATVFNQNIGSWDVSAVTNIGGMFRSAPVFNQDISSWVVSAVTNMGDMFSGATVFNQNIGGWNVTAVTDMSFMFLNVTLSTINYDALLTGWEAQAVQNNVTFHGGNSQFSAGAPATARADLIADHTWAITDGGQV